MEHTAVFALSQLPKHKQTQIQQGQKNNNNNNNYNSSSFISNYGMCLMEQKGQESCWHALPRRRATKTDKTRQQHHLRIRNR